jgi:hypothetical protein
MCCGSIALDRWICDQQHPGMHYCETVSERAEIIPHFHLACRDCEFEHARVASEDAVR